MTLRRRDDHEIRLVLARSRNRGIAEMEEGSAIELEGFKLDVRDRTGPADRTETPREAEDSAFLFDAGGAEAILVSGAGMRRLPRGEGGEDLLRRAAAGAAAWRRERHRVTRRLLLPDRLIAFSEAVAGARDLAEVDAAVALHSARIVGGFFSVVFRSRPGSPDLHPVWAETLPRELRNVSIRDHACFRRSGLIGAEDARPDTGGPFGDLAPLFSATGACGVAHAPFGDDAVVLLVERRQERQFEASDWELFQTVIRQASAAAERVRLLDEVRRLSLTDPLTGLANRRRMNVVLEHSLARARRNDPLAVAMIDLDNFKAINDLQGHIEGDRILCQVARCLQEEARGSDVVVRYGGDEFLVVFPGGDDVGAAAYITRVRAALGADISFSAGIAEYDPRFQRPEQLIEAADRNLYGEKRPFES